MAISCSATMQSLYRNREHKIVVVHGVELESIRDREMEQYSLPRCKNISQDLIVISTAQPQSANRKRSLTKS